MKEKKFFVLIRKLEKKDREEIKIILEEIELFKKKEIDVAMELIDVSLNNSNQNDYHIFCCVDDMDIVIGYYCIGKRPMTKFTFDLYWIAVKKKFQNSGVGKFLLNDAENYLKKIGCKLLLVETSSQSKYENTNKFYLSCDYTQIVRIKKFYNENDDLIIYSKYF